MTTKAGVWIDHKQAIVVLITGAGQKIKKFKSGIERPAGSGSKHKYTPNDFVAEDRLERKVVNHRKQYYDEVIGCVRDAEAILVLGPGEAKEEFVKRIKIKKRHGSIAEVETTDKMTDRQIAAKVGKHFAKAPARKFAAPKKTAKAKSGKRMKKSGK